MNWVKHLVHPWIFGFLLGASDFPSLSGNSAETSALMAALNEHGQYELTDFDAEILADYATEKQLLKSNEGSIKPLNYVEDPHTAVASAVYQKYLAETGDQLKTVIASTASTYKFSQL